MESTETLSMESMEVEVEDDFNVTDKNLVKLACVCDNCGKLLNVEPIYLINNPGTRFSNKVSTAQICGRCKSVLKEFPLEKQCRQYTYENLAKHITYPCSNKGSGCTAILNWNNVLDHEIICEFQTVACPLSHDDIFPVEKCSWLGNIKTLNLHIEFTHKERIIAAPNYSWMPPFKVESTIFFTHVGSQLITVVIKSESEAKYYCLLMVNGNDIESQCFRYQLELFDENRENSILLRKTRLEPLNYMLENMKNPDKMLEIDINKIKEMLKNTNIIHGRFGIVKKSKKEIINIVGTKDHSLLLGSTTSKEKEVDNQNDDLFQFNETMLQELECPVCNEYMVAPIFICQAGHSICGECKVKLTRCPSCKSSLLGTRNFTLEKLTSKVPYPCRNRELGCLFVSTSNKVRSHELSCKLTETTCIVSYAMKCTYKCLRPSMYNHLVEQHSDILVENNSIQKRSISDKRDACYVFHTAGELFIMTVRTHSHSQKFSVHHMGMIEGEPTFSYNLQLLSQTQRGQHLSITKPCDYLAARSGPNALNIPEEMLKPFVDDDKIFHYKINITRTAP